MDIEITQKGVFDRSGEEIAVGKILMVDESRIPAGLLNKCRVLGAAPKGAPMLVNPAPVKLPEIPQAPADAKLEAKHRGRGSWSIMSGELELVPGMSKEDAESFNEMSDDDKVEYVDAVKR